MSAFTINPAAGSESDWITGNYLSNISNAFRLSDEQLGEYPLLALTQKELAHTSPVPHRSATAQEVAHTLSTLRRVNSVLDQVPLRWMAIELMKQDCSQKLAAYQERQKSVGKPMKSVVRIHTGPKAGLEKKLGGGRTLKQQTKNLPSKKPHIFPVSANNVAGVYRITSKVNTWIGGDAGVGQPLFTFAPNTVNATRNRSSSTRFHTKRTLNKKTASSTTGKKRGARKKVITGRSTSSSSASSSVSTGSSTSASSGLISRSGGSSHKNSGTQIGSGARSKNVSRAHRPPPVARRKKQSTKTTGIVDMSWSFTRHGPWTDQIHSKWKQCFGQSNAQKSHKPLSITTATCPDAIVTPTTAGSATITTTASATSTAPTVNPTPEDADIEQEAVTIPKQEVQNQTKTNTDQIKTDLVALYQWENTKVDRFGVILDQQQRQEGTHVNSIFSTHGIHKINQQLQSEEVWAHMATNWTQYQVKKRRKQFKRRLYEGIPDSMRAMVWTKMTEGMVDRGGVSYSELLKHKSEYTDTIRRDLERTFPEHIFFQNDNDHVMKEHVIGKDGDSSGREALFRVCEAYACYDKETGYCQSMGFLAGIFLMYLPEEGAFWMLAAILRHDKFQLHGLYRPGFPLLHVFFRMFKKFLAANCREFVAHTTTLGEEVEMEIRVSDYATSWFMCLFISCLPFKSCLTVIDLLLFHGPKVLFQVATYIIQINQPLIAEMDYEQFQSTIRNLPQSIDEDRLFDPANGCLQIKISNTRFKRMLTVCSKEEQKLQAATKARK